MLLEVGAFAVAFFGQDWFRRHFAISPFWEKKVFVIQRLIVTKKSEFCTQPHFVVKKKLFFVKLQKKTQKFLFFFSNFDFFRKKTCTRTSRRAFFENSFKIGLFTFLQKIRILLGRKKRPVPRKYKILQDSCPPKSKWQIWSWSCGENLWGDIWVGAVSRCGCGVRVRFTCGQDFARTGGSDFYIIFRADATYSTIQKFLYPQ